MMSSSSSKVVVGGGGDGRKGNNGMNDILSGSRKIVQSLKEVVNSPEAEIYAMLKECNMDPKEAVHRLISQDSGNLHGKSTNKKESGTQGYASSWSSTSNHQRTPHSDSVVTENKLPSAAGNEISVSQPASGHQTAWFGAPGQMSMADIVKMRRPQNKTTNSKQNVNMRSEINREHEEVNANHQVPVKDEWSSIQKPLAPGTSSVSVAPAESEVCDGRADFQTARVDQHLSDRLENIHLAENGPSENLGVDQVQPDSVTGKNVQEDDSSEFNENQYAYQTQHKGTESSLALGTDDHNLENEDGSFYGSSDEEASEAYSMNKDTANRREKFHMLGYRDGISAGQEAAAQEGYNVGYKESVLAGYKFGIVRGVSSALAFLPDDLREKLIDEQETREKFQNLHGSLHDLSTEIALKLFYGALSTRQGEEKSGEEEEPCSSLCSGSGCVSATNDLGSYVTEFSSLLDKSPKINEHRRKIRVE